MTNNRKKNSRPQQPPLSPPTSGVFSLRLPAPLRSAADRYADATGVSLNGLMCIALADYLASRGHQVKG